MVYNIPSWPRELRTKLANLADKNYTVINLSYPGATPLIERKAGE
jgi:hypothetical protein